MRSFNSDIPDSGIRPKLAQVRKLCDTVNKMSQPETTNQDIYKQRVPVTPPPVIPQKPAAPRDDDLTFFICSVVSELATRMVGLADKNIKEWATNVPAEALVKKFREANVNSADTAPNEVHCRDRRNGSQSA